MTKIILMLLATSAFGYIICADNATEAASDISDVSSESTDVKDVQDDSDRRGASAIAVAGGVQKQKQWPRKSPILVECYVCTDCPHVNKEMSSKLCPHSMDPNKRGKCVVYAEKYKHMHRPWYIRGCATERGSCDDIRRAHENHKDLVNLLFCQECEGERCNTNGASTFANYTIAFITLLTTSFISKFTMT